MKALAGLFGAVFTLVLAVAIVAAGPSGSPPPSAAAIGEIPADLLSRYVDAANTCEGLPWQVLAAIGFTESRHAQGRANATTGDVDPPIFGPALDGTHGTTRIADVASPDGWMHAQGPMQFLPTTWSRWGRLAPGRPADATPSPHNAWDAIYSAAAYLCAGRAQIDDLKQAILSYNHSSEYLHAVMNKAGEYGLGSDVSQAAISNGMTCPVVGAVSFTDTWGAPRSGGRTHQGTDIVAPYGSPLVAIESGLIDQLSDVDQGLGGITIWLRGDSGDRYYYAHNAGNITRVGQRVSAGQVVGYVGNTGNARTSIAHLHFEIHPGGGPAINPYPMLAVACQPEN
ncbi:MAG: peptidoglycan DD-metalloendopeptidase family protein [Acidimicrobiia bacterium]